MKTTSIVLHLFVAFVLVSCGGHVENTNTIDDKTAEIIECKSLLVIAEDCSGSATNHKHLEASDYTEIITTFIDKYSGQVAVGVIGNPEPDAREFMVLEVAGLKPYMNVPKDALMSEQGMLNKQNAGIREANALIIEENNRQMKDLVSGNITKHVLNYAPYKKKDMTNIADAFEHLSDKVNEPTFRNYDKIQILIISDGIHDATKLEKPLSFSPDIGIELFLIGWGDDAAQVFSGVENRESFDSVKGFIAYYKGQNCEK